MGRKLNSVDFLDFGIEFFKKNLKKLIILMLFYYIPLTFISSYLMNTGSILRVINGTEYDELWLPILVKFIAGYGISGIYSLIFAPAFSISIIYFTYRKIRFCEDLKPKEIVKYGFKKFGWVLLLTLILSQGITIIAYVILLPIEIFVMVRLSWYVLLIIGIIAAAVLIVAVYFYARLYFATPMIALKNKNCFTALAASWKYTKGRAWIVFKTLFWRIVLVSMLPGVFTAIGQLLSLTSITASGLLSALLSTLGAIVTPVGIIIDTILFIFCEHEIADDEKEDKYVDLFESKGITSL